MRVTIFAVAACVTVFVAAQAQVIIPNDEAEPGLPSVEVPMPDTCGADGLQGLIGQSGEVARLLEFDGPARLLPPGTPMTMDMRLDRINIDIDEDDVITRIYCG